MSITTNQEAVMSTSVPTQHPAVVLRSQYRQLRSLVAVLVVAVIGLSTTLVVVAGDDTKTTTATSVSRAYPTLADTFQSESPRPDTKPDESKIATAISPQQSVSSPDESKIAAAISEHSETGPVARARAYQQALNDMTPEQRANAFSGHK
jgi:hypothetical protein